MRYRNSTRRGRPRLPRPSADRGTPELIAKRAVGLTSEALDLCLSRGLLLQEEHDAGMRLRWLYTLRFGAPGARIASAQMLTSEQRLDDPNWRAAREKEYTDALLAMGPMRGAKVLAVCIFGERPAYLSASTYSHNLSRASAEHNARELAMLREGLGASVRVFRRWREQERKEAQLSA